jgi:mRNA interferase HicA
VKSSEFIRYLKNHGVTFSNGKGSHKKAYLNGRQSVVPDHGSKEIGEGLRRAILKQLGMKE